MAKGVGDRVKRFSHGLVFLAALLGPASANHPKADSATLPARKPLEDPRLGRLRRFFLERKAPVHNLAEEFLAASDRHKLDWRLLPSLAIVESGGGREARNNNIFGWDSGKKAFRTVKEGIHHVAGRLGSSRLYKNKSLDAILRTYNRNADYPPRVRSLIQALGPAAIPATR